MLLFHSPENLKRNFTYENFNSRIAFNGCLLSNYHLRIYSLAYLNINSLENIGFTSDSLIPTRMRQRGSNSIRADSIERKFLISTWSRRIGSLSSFFVVNLLLSHIKNTLVYTKTTKLLLFNCVFYLKYPKSSKFSAGWWCEDMRDRHTSSNSLPEFLSSFVKRSCKNTSAPLALELSSNNKQAEY